MNFLPINGTADGRALLLTIPLWCLCPSTGMADTARTNAQCVRITPATSDPNIPASVVQHDKTSANKVFYCLALVERPQGGSSETPIDADIKRVYILSADDGRTSVRVFDLPDGMGQGGF